ncbi:hypothetical protein EV401DRAFT_1890634 [Pisolithus croceorrhizus]|nr:hypothetical protein EV401DRAFT_1890634 [Pisolithus croceorrhizus]
MLRLPITHGVGMYPVRAAHFGVVWQSEITAKYPQTIDHTLPAHRPSHRTETSKDDELRPVILCVDQLTGVHGVGIILYLHATIQLLHCSLLIPGILDQRHGPKFTEAFKQSIQIALDHVARVNALAHMDVLKQFPTFRPLEISQNAYQAGNNPAQTKDFLKTTGVGAFPLLLSDPQSAASGIPIEQHLIAEMNWEARFLYEKLKRIRESSGVVAQHLSTLDTARLKTGAPSQSKRPIDTIRSGMIEDCSFTGEQPPPSNSRAKEYERKGEDDGTEVRSDGLAILDGDYLLSLFYGTTEEERLRFEEGPPYYLDGSLAHRAVWDQLEEADQEQHTVSPAKTSFGTLPVDWGNLRSCLVGWLRIPLRMPICARIPLDPDIPFDVPVARFLTSSCLRPLPHASSLLAMPQAPFDMAMPLCISEELARVSVLEHTNIENGIGVKAIVRAWEDTLRVLQDRRENMPQISVYGQMHALDSIVCEREAIERCLDDGDLGKPPTKRICLSLLALAKRASLDKIAPPPAELVLESIWGMVPTAELPESVPS